MSRATEIFGMTVEKAFADSSTLECKIDESRIDREFYAMILPLVKKLTSRIPEITSYVGHTTKSIDFLLDGEKTLSVKTNHNGFKVCPQEIGQTTKRRFCEKFNISGDIPEIKKFIQTHTNEVIRQMWTNTFCCDYLIWIYFDGSWKADIFKKIDYPFSDKFSFTRGIANWEESTTVKIGKISIGEFQIHKHRDCVKFRFDMQKILSNFVHPVEHVEISSGRTVITLFLKKMTTNF